LPYKDVTTRKLKQKQYSRAWYQKNKKAHIHKVWLRKDRERVKWQEYKAKQKCSHCGFSHPAVIDFHHIIKENKKSVNILISKYGKYNAAIREAEEKCIPLCSNCHRILHWNEHNESTRRRRKKRGNRR
jgi:hypothetical protein